METRQIFLELKDKFQADLVLIQDNEARFQVYGSNLSQLVTELKLPQKVKNDEGPININLRSIDDIESHLIWNNHTYLLLKLYISDDKSPVNKKKYIVERATNPDAIGLEYDNRNNDGQYPKSHHIVHEVLTKNNSLELCQEQIDTLFEIDSWLKSDNPIAILDGRAGSGKTTLLKYVVSMLEKKKKTFKLLALTANAKRILHNKTNYPTSTIHSEIYEFDIDKMNITDDGDKQQLKFEENDFSIDFKIKSQESYPHIYIIDEASMIGNKEKAKGELNYGTGRLMRDLLYQTGVIYNKNANAKILFVGDRFQLPPILENESIAMNPSRLLEEYKLPALPLYLELKTVHRQDKNSLVLKNAETLRSCLEEKSYVFPKFHVDEKNVYRTTPERINSKLKNHEHNSNHIVITSSNYAAHSYNKSLRASIHGSKEEDLMPNDLIIVMKNTLSGDVSNGDILRVISILDSEKKQVVLSKSPKYKRQRKIVNLYYKKIIARHIHYNDNRHDIEILVSENLLKGPGVFPEKDEIIAARVDWNNRIKTKKYSLDEKKLSYLNDPYINAIPIKYAYALTCHKAQGSEWNDVSIHLKMNHQNDEGGLRWLYTAMTRSKGELSFVNLPR